MGDWDPPDAFDPRQDKCFHNLQILFWWYIVTLVLFILLLKLFYTRFFSNLIVWASNLLEWRLLYVINENNTKTTLSPVYRFLVFRFLLAYVFYRFFQSKYEWKPVPIKIPEQENVICVKIFTSIFMSIPRTWGHTGPQGLGTNCRKGTLPFKLNCCF